MSYQNGIIHHLIQNRIEIFFPDGDEQTISESNIVSESMTLKQSICDSDELRFGGCIASEFSIKLLNTADRSFTNELTGKWISVKMTQKYADPDAPVLPSGDLYPCGSLFPGKTTGEQSFWIFSGYIDSAKTDKTDKNIVNIVAYDVLAKLYEADATNMLYELWLNSSYVYNLGYLFSRILQNNGVFTIQTTGTTAVLNEYYKWNPNKSVQSYAAYNTDWRNSKDKISFGQLLKDICELIGVFGVIVPGAGKGNFTFRRLSGDVETYRFYEELIADDYESTGYTDFRFSVAGSSTGKSASGVYTVDNTLVGGLSDAADGAVDKMYDFTKNILLWENIGTSGRTTTDTDMLINRSSIGTRLALNAESTEHRGQCAFSSYQPLTATLDGRLWVNVGAPIEILVSRTTVDGDYVLDENNHIIKDSVYTYVLSRTLTGIQALTDRIEAKGVG